MLFDQLLRTPAKWMGANDERDIVLRSRIRLARNLLKKPFPGWATKTQRANILTQLTEATDQLTSLKGGFYAELGDLSSRQKQILSERQLISKELATRSESSAVSISRNQNLSILFNEDDHIRLQYTLPGIQLKKAWNAVSKIDEELAQLLPYALHPRFGYLATNPSHIGSGMKASVVLHLPGIVLSEHMTHVMQAASQLRLNIRNLYGDGSVNIGNLFVVSNASYHLNGEEAALERVQHFAMDLAKQEWNMRRILLQDHPLMLRDKVARAHAILSQAELISFRESIDLLSILRMGASLHLFPAQFLEKIDETVHDIQPAHLHHQFASGQLLSTEEGNHIRAKILQQLFTEQK